MRTWRVHYYFGEQNPVCPGDIFLFYNVITIELGCCTAAVGFDSVAHERKMFLF